MAHPRKGKMRTREITKEPLPSRPYQEGGNIVQSEQPLPLDQELGQFLEGQVGEKEVAGTLMEKLLLEDDMSNTQDPNAAASAFAKMFRENPEFAKKVMAMIESGQTMEEDPRHHIPTEGGGSQWPGYQGQWGGFHDQHQGGEFQQTQQPKWMDPRFGPEMEKNKWLQGQEQEYMMRKLGEGNTFQQGGQIPNRSSRRTPMDDKVARVLLNQLTMRNVKK